MNERRKSAPNMFAKECIVAALLQLIKQKPLSAINISELCSVAGVSRMTFYRNYDSIEDIFKKELDDIFIKYEDDDIEHCSSLNFYDRTNILHYLSYMLNYRDFVDGLFNCGFSMYFLEKMIDFIIKRWNESADKTTLYAFAGSLFSIFQMWSTERYQTPPDTLASQIEKIYITYSGTTSFTT